MLPANPLITVGIPTYNGEKYIEEAVQSVLNQSYTNIEVIISDNCSTDNTAAVITAIQQKDARVKYFRQPFNAGFINNFNSIPLKSNADYFIFFADDDIYDRDYIKLLWEEFVKDPTITLAMGSVKLITPEKELIEHVNNFTKANTASLTHLKPVERIAKIIRYGHNREWSWGINLALHKREALLKHPYNKVMIDPGTLFYRSIVYEGAVGFNPDAVFYKRTGGLSGSQNYGRPVETLKTKYDDVKNEVLQLLYEFKIMWIAHLSFGEKIQLTGTFLRYRFPELLKRNFLFTASFFSFLLVKKPIRFIKKLIGKK